MRKSLFLFAVTAGLLLSHWHNTHATRASDPKDDAKSASNVEPPPVGAEQPVDCRGVHNVVTFAPGLISGSVPDGDAGFDSLNSMGVKTVISVDGAMPAVEKAMARGMKYIHLPIGYNGMNRQRTMEIARAIQLAQQSDPNAPVYLHCHHGKHRSASALAGAAVTLGYLTPEQGQARMKVSGTSPSYTGLFRCVTEAVTATPEELAAMPTQFPSIWKSSGLVRSMVEVDEIYEHLKLIEKAGWVAPKDHPDLVPAAEAGRLADVYLHLLNEERVKAKPAEFRDWLIDASKWAENLEAGLAHAGHPPDELSKRFERVTKSCKECHVKYRD